MTAENLNPCVIIWGCKNTLILGIRYSTGPFSRGIRELSYIIILYYYYLSLKRRLEHHLIPELVMVLLRVQCVPFLDQFSGIRRLGPSQVEVVPGHLERQDRRTQRVVHEHDGYDVTNPVLPTQFRQPDGRVQLPVLLLLVVVVVVTVQVHHVQFVTDFRAFRPNRRQHVFVQITSFVRKT